MESDGVVIVLQFEVVRSYEGGGGNRSELLAFIGINGLVSFRTRLIKRRVRRLFSPKFQFLFRSPSPACSPRDEAYETSMSVS